MKNSVRCINVNVVHRYSRDRALLQGASSINNLGPRLRPQIRFPFTMLSFDIAEQIRSAFPGTEELIVHYLSGYLVDDAGEDEDILEVARDMLESIAGDEQKIVDTLMSKIGELLADQLSARAKNSAAPKLTKLDKVMDMSKAGAMSNTLALGAEGVDLESINKGK